MGEKSLESQQPRRVRSQCLVQPVTRFVAAMALTVVNGRLELRPETPTERPPMASVQHPADQR
jgi:hypothetical protein